MIATEFSYRIWHVNHLITSTWRLKAISKWSSERPDDEVRPICFWKHCEWLRVESVGVTAPTGLHLHPPLPLECLCWFSMRLWTSVSTQPEKRGLGKSKRRILDLTFKSCLRETEFFSFFYHPVWVCAHACLRTWVRARSISAPNHWLKPSDWNVDSGATSGFYSCIGHRCECC